jgi:hypothetical protein
MNYHYQPMKAETNNNCISLDGYMQKENLNLIGPFRKSGIVLYYDATKGKFLNPKSNSYLGV